MMEQEMIDVLTENGEETGRVEPRKVIHAKGLWHRTVHVWMHNRNGELLFQKRSLKKETHPGLWDISCAGHIAAGESCRKAAVREAVEELGIVIDSNMLRYLFTTRHQWLFVDKRTGIQDNEIPDVFLYTKPIEINEISPDGNEVESVVFLSPQQVKNQLLSNKNSFVPHDEEYERVCKEVTS